MKIVEKALTYAFVLKQRVFKDDRGYFYESYNEEIAYEQGVIDADQLKQIAEPLVKSGYGK